LRREEQRKSEKERGDERRGDERGDLSLFDDSVFGWKSVRIKVKNYYQQTCRLQTAVYTVFLPFSVTRGGDAEEDI